MSATDTTNKNLSAPHDVRACACARVLEDRARRQQPHDGTITHCSTASIYSANPPGGGISPGRSRHTAPLLVPGIVPGNHPCLSAADKPIPVESASPAGLQPRQRLHIRACVRARYCASGRVRARIARYLKERPAYRHTMDAQRLKNAVKGTDASPAIERDGDDLIVVKLPNEAGFDFQQARAEGAEPVMLAADRAGTTIVLEELGGAKNDDSGS